MIEKSFEGKLKKLGYEEHVYSRDRKQLENGVNGESKPEEIKVENPGERMAQFLLESKILGPYTPLEKISNLFQCIWDGWI